MKDVLSSARAYPLPLPFVPGAGAIGRVHSTGPDATHLEAGQLVFVDCYVEARDLWTNHFLQGLSSGHTDGGRRLAQDVWRDGTFAEYTRAPLENVYPLDESILTAPSLSDEESHRNRYTLSELSWIPALMVPFGGLADASVQPGDTVIVAPATGLFGRAAVAVSLALGARDIACGRNMDTLKVFPAQFGVSTAQLVPVQMSGDIKGDTAALLSVTGPKGADVYQDWSPAVAAVAGVSPPHIAACINALRYGGTVSLMGGIRGNIEIPYSTVMRRNLRILGRFMYTHTQVEQLIKMLERGTLKLGAAHGTPILKELPLEDFEEALKISKEDFGQNGIVTLRP